jgi:hypothetical protein
MLSQGPGQPRLRPRLAPGYQEIVTETPIGTIDVVYGRY